MICKKEAKLDISVRIIFLYFSQIFEKRVTVRRDDRRDVTKYLKWRGMMGNNNVYV